MCLLNKSKKPAPWTFACQATATDPPENTTEKTVPSDGSFGSRLCENVPGRSLLRIVSLPWPHDRWCERCSFCVALKLRCKFYFPDQRQSFHTAWVRFGRRAQLPCTAAHPPIA